MKMGVECACVSRRDGRTLARMRTLYGSLALVLALAAPVLAQTAPSSAHPRLFMSAADLAAYQADMGHSGSPTASAIADCQDAIAHPSQNMDRGGSDGNTWPRVALSCAFAYRVTNQMSYLTQALASWHAALDDDQTLGDHMGCVAGTSTDWQTWAASGSGMAPAIIRTVTHDTGYPIRWYAPFIALVYDWLNGAPGVDAALLGQTRTCLSNWIDWYAAHGYHHDQAGANYGAGFVAGQALVGVAIGTDGGADGHIFSGAIHTYRDVLIAQGLANQSTPGAAGPLVGGDWLEGWQYGPLSIYEYALGARVLSDFGVSLPEMSDWIDAVAVRHVYGLVPTADAQWCGGGDFDDSDHVYCIPNENVINGVLVGPSSDQAAAYVAGLDDGNNPAFPVYAAFARRRTVTPVDFHATTPSQPLWYVSRGSRGVYARTDWTTSAFWAVFQSAPVLVDDHEHFAASNFAFSRGADHLIVDSSQYGAFGTLETNGLTADSPLLAMHGDYAMTQTPWSQAELVWARNSDGVIAARSDLAHAFIFSDTPSDIPYAHREWVLLPEGQIVTIDRVHTADATHTMHVRFHANTVAGGHLMFAGIVATGTVGGSHVAIHQVSTAGGTAHITAPDHLSDSSNCAGSYPYGPCNDARFAVDIYALDVPGPYASAVHVIDGYATTGATVGSINDATYADAMGNTQVVGAAVFSAMHQSYVLASSAHDGAAGATITYSVPGTSASRHVVFDAPEASDGTSNVAALASGGRCAITITAGSGGGFTGHPLVFHVDTAANACAVMDGGNVDPGMPPTGGSDAGPRADAGPQPDGGVAPGTDGGTHSPASSSCGCSAAGAGNGHGVLALLFALVYALRRPRRT